MLGNPCVENEPVVNRILHNHRRQSCPCLNGRGETCTTKFIHSATKPEWYCQSFTHWSPYQWLVMSSVLLGFFQSFRLTTYPLPLIILIFTLSLTCLLSNHLLTPISHFHFSSLLTQNNQRDTSMVWTELLITTQNIIIYGTEITNINYSLFTRVLDYASYVQINFSY